MSSTNLNIESPNDKKNEEIYIMKNLKQVLTVGTIALLLTACVSEKPKPNEIVNNNTPDTQEIAQEPEQAEEEFTSAHDAKINDQDGHFEITKIRTNNNMLNEYYSRENQHEFVESEYAEVQPEGHFSAMNQSVADMMNEIEDEITKNIQENPIDASINNSNHIGGVLANEGGSKNGYTHMDVNLNSPIRLSMENEDISKIILVDKNINAFAQNKVDETFDYEQMLKNDSDDVIKEIIFENDQYIASIIPSHKITDQGEDVTNEFINQFKTTEVEEIIANHLIAI